MELMEYTLHFSPKALEDITYFKKSEPSLKNKINRLFSELQVHPETGIGQPEKLRFDLAGYLSRRINLEHRLLYQIDEDNHKVYIISLRGHY